MRTTFHDRKLEYSSTNSSSITSSNLQETPDLASTETSSLEFDSRQSSVFPSYEVGVEACDGYFVHEDEKLPPAISLLIIVGTSLALWAIIGLAVWHAIS